MKGPYDGIIGLPHHEPENHPRMPRADRAAQFSPFAALSGYSDAIRETGRLREKRTILGDEARVELDGMLHLIGEGKGPVTVHAEHYHTYNGKDGEDGRYVTTEGIVMEVTEDGTLHLAGGETIKAEDIRKLTIMDNI